MEIKPIRTDADHDRALQEIERLWGAPEGTDEGDRLEVWVTLVEAWERSHVAPPAVDPIAAIEFRLEQLGLDAKALNGVIGSRSRVYEVLKGERQLTLPMIRRLVERLGIPAEILIRAPGGGRNEVA
ncbi:MAG: transcriptional regulator [Candidatus Sericytochromatia bacterium]|nr:transcriptional regulator [Candidatus Sericytochromatia bacterium]